MHLSVENLHDVHLGAHQGAAHSKAACLSVASAPCEAYRIADVRVVEARVVGRKQCSKIVCLRAFKQLQKKKHTAITLLISSLENQKVEKVRNKWGRNWLTAGSPSSFQQKFKTPGRLRLVAST